MSKQAINIVWLKRDLRTQDHAAFAAAEQAALPYVTIFMVEPSIMAYPDTSLRHLQFQYQSVLQLNKFFAPLQKSIWVCYAEALEVFAWFNQHYAVQHVFSYQESGIQLTYTRDKAVAKLLQSHQVNWVQFQRDGIVRGIKDRTSWDKMWYTVMSQPVIKNTYVAQTWSAPSNPFELPLHLQTLWSEVNSLFQPAGESFAYQYLQSFLAKRGANYSYHISKPALSRLSCSRLSPYLAWGNISIKQVYQITSVHLRTSSSKKAFLNFLSRTKWHCHFIQKFEQDCTYETHYLNKGYEALALSNNLHYLEAWKQGKTGVPLVDACMRCLHQTGWINFRMRALLVSFLTHHLDIDFRLGAHHLAQLFLDYEPGIHYPQLQMHAGTTGVNLLRVYNPVKNALQHDADAVFTKKWVPELAHLPVPLVHHPWLMTPMDNLLYNFELGKHYPAPIVNVEGGAKANVQKIWDLRHTETTQHEMRRIIKSHTRPKKADAKRSKK